MQNKKSSTSGASTFSPFSSGLFSKNKNKGADQDMLNTKLTSSLAQKPATLEGWLEKKGHAKVAVGGDWQKR
jgi:hypothetical protein